MTSGRRRGVAGGKPFRVLELTGGIGSALHWMRSLQMGSQVAVIIRAHSSRLPGLEDTGRQSYRMQVYEGA